MNEIPRDSTQMPSPPVLLLEADRQSSSVRKVLAILLSLCLGLFLADAVVSLLDESLILFFGVRVVTVLRGMLSLLTVLAGIGVYVLMGLTPMVPKREFLPVALFNPVAGLVMVPFVIYFYNRSEQIAWVISLCQVIVGLAILYLVQGSFKFRWPPVSDKQLGARGFSWRNLSIFLVMNVFVLVPAVIVYLVLCAGSAIAHFSEGFLALRPSGLTVSMRKYVREDGKTI